MQGIRDKWPADRFPQRAGDVSVVFRCIARTLGGAGLSYRASCGTVLAVSAAGDHSVDRERRVSALCRCLRGFLIQEASSLLQQGMRIQVHGWRGNPPVAQKWIQSVCKVLEGLNVGVSQELQDCIRMAHKRLNTVLNPTGSTVVSAFRAFERFAVDSDFEDSVATAVEGLNKVLDAELQDASGTWR